jgi:hypothetical protein
MVFGYYLAGKAMRTNRTNLTRQIATTGQDSLLMTDSESRQQVSPLTWRFTFS